MADHAHDDDGEEGEDPNYDPEAQVTGNWKKVDLPQIPVVTGEEEEDVLFKAKSKVYRFRGEWKERGVGELKFLKHKKSQLVRLLVRAEKTHKCIVNHYLQKKDIFCILTKMNTSNNAWTWAAYDVSDDAPRSEKLCAKFTNKDDYDRFQVEFDQACVHNQQILSKEKKPEVQAEKPAEKKEEPKEELKKVEM